MTRLVGFVQTWVLLFALPLVTIEVADAGEWEEAFPPVLKVYAPSGFDDNDDTQVVIEGYLPDLCHKSVRHKASVSGQTIQIELYSYRDTRARCARMSVPFLEVVSLGQLSAGQYNVLINEGSLQSAKTDIEVSTALRDTQDNYVYANVTRIDGLRPDERRGSYVTLRGRTPSTCMVVDRVETVPNGMGTLSILPIMKQVSTRCPSRSVPFSVKVAIPYSATTPRMLLHVRAMDGRSVNGIYHQEPDDRR